MTFRGVVIPVLQFAVCGLQLTVSRFSGYSSGLGAAGARALLRALGGPA